MFNGTIPPDARGMISQLGAMWRDRDDAWVVCSGNFTLERILRADGFKAHGNDVSVYSVPLGRWLTGQPAGLKLKQETQESHPWIGRYMDDGVGTVATVMMGTQFFKHLGKKGLYFEHEVELYRKQWDRLVPQTIERLSTMEFRLDSFYAGDVVDFVKQVPKDDPLLMFPPFWAGGYEKLFKPLNEVFDWEPPEYRVFDEDEIDDFMAEVTNRPRWWFAAEHELPQYEEHLKGSIQLNAKSEPVMVYASDGPVRLVKGQQRILPVTIPRMGPGDRVTSLSIKKLKSGEFESLRLMYLNKQIAVSANADVTPFAVLCDGKLAGVFAFGAWMGVNTLFLMTDFAVSGTDYPRLSKLVVMAAMSQEAKDSIEQGWSRKCRVLQTTVFSQRPVSMKYRGLWDRTADEPVKDGAFAHKLTYKTAAGQWTLDEALAMWQEKWGNLK